MWEGVKGQPPKSPGVFDKPAKNVMDERIVQRATAYIRKQVAEKKPFFISVGSILIHPPIGVHPEFLGKSGGGLYADMLTEMDYRSAPA
jgi:hypothetical protein